MLPGEQDLHLLAAGVDVVQPLILVVLQRGEVPDAVAERAHRVHRLERRQQRRRAAAPACPGTTVNDSIAPRAGDRARSTRPSSPQIELRSQR